MKAQLSRFLAVGLLNTAVGYAVIFICMYWLGMAPESSNAAGYAFGLLVSFMLSRNFTFRSIGQPSGEALRFAVAFAAAYGVNLLVLVALIHSLAVHSGLSQLLAGAAYVAVSYLLNDRFVFRRSSRQIP
jgi:putative flippase GtrA